MSGEFQQIGQFTILAKLGEGAMGTVYKAAQPSLDRVVAIKVLPPHMATDASFITRFQNEAASAAALSHINIVKVHDAGEAGGHHYFAMEFVDGETLGARMKRNGRIPPHEALTIAMNVASGLEHAWKKARLIHRDVKPDNIFLSTKGEVKVGDLGLAKALTGKRGESTIAGQIMGTPHYISPEQARAAGDIDFRADIYSLGCTLFHALCGQPPYMGDTAMRVVLQHVESAVPKIKTRWPECPPAIAELLDVMLRKDPAERHESYEALIADFANIIEHTVQLAVETSLVVQAPKSRIIEVTPERPRIFWKVAALVLVAVVAVMAWQPWRNDAPQPVAITVPPEPKKQPPTPQPAPTPRPTPKPVQQPVPVIVAPAPAVQPPQQPVPVVASVPEIPDGYVRGEPRRIFNGTDLSGWAGLTDFWSVRDGAITADTTKTNRPTRDLTSLIWQGGDVADFEFTCLFKLAGKPPELGISGIHFRSKLTDPSYFELRGYHADLDYDLSRIGKLVEKNGRNFEILRGKKAVMKDGPTGNAVLVENIGEFGTESFTRKDIKRSDWNEYRIVAAGNRIQLFINGKPSVDVRDETKAAQKSGLLGLNILYRSVFTAQFKDLVLTELTPPPTPPAAPVPVVFRKLYETGFEEPEFRQRRGRDLEVLDVRWTEFWKTPDQLKGRAAKGMAVGVVRPKLGLQSLEILSIRAKWTEMGATFTMENASDILEVAGDVWLTDSHTNTVWKFATPAGGIAFLTDGRVQLLTQKPALAKYVARRNVWMNVKLRMDTKRQVYDVLIDNKLAAASVPFLIKAPRVRSFSFSTMGHVSGGGNDKGHLDNFVFAGAQ